MAITYVRLHNINILVHGFFLFGDMVLYRQYFWIYCVYKYLPLLVMGISLFRTSS